MYLEGIFVVISGTVSVLPSPFSEEQHLLIEEDMPLGRLQT